MEKANPFGALVGVSTIIVAILYLAGFSYKWAYYYNFGVQHLVLQQSFQAFLITSMELIRVPTNLLITLVCVWLPLILLNALISFVGRLEYQSPKTYKGKVVRILINAFGLDTDLGVDILRALVIVYTSFMVSSQLGYMAFRSHIVDSITNPLPAVTLIMDRKPEESELPLTCGASGEKHAPLIGDEKTLRTIQNAFRTCNDKGHTWRLLYRDDKAIYVFASRAPELIRNGRPLTLVVPNDGKTYLVME